MKSRLIALYDDPNFAVNTIKQDSGLTVNQYGDVINYLTLFYTDFVEVYLCLEDDPLREDILVKGSGSTLAAARRDAVRKFNTKAYRTPFHKKTPY